MANRNQGVLKGQYCTLITKLLTKTIITYNKQLIKNDTHKCYSTETCKVLLNIKELLLSLPVCTKYKTDKCYIEQKTSERENRPALKHNNLMMSLGRTVL